jgi:uncharacterized protein YjdB
VTCYNIRKYVELEGFKLKNAKKKISLLVSTLFLTSIFSISNFTVNQISFGNNVYAATLSHRQTANQSSRHSSNNVSVTSIALNKTTDTLVVGSRDTLTATITPTNAENKAVSWTSSDTSIATVKNGEVKAVSAGTAVITATSVDGNYTASCTVTVTPAVPVTSISLNKTTDTLVAGTTDTLSATISPSNATNTGLKWVSSNRKVAQVENGVVKAVRTGTAIITVTSKDGDYTASCTVTVTPAVQVTSISLNKTTDTLVAGTTDTLSATISPSNATNSNLRWTSSNRRVAQVQNGVVTAVGTGTSIIIVTDGRYAASCTVTVTSPVVSVTSVSLNKTTDSIVVGNTDQLIATVSPTNATNSTVTWTTSDSTVATVASDGTVTAIGAGTVTITATTADGGYTASCTVTVTNQ